MSETAHVQLSGGAGSFAAGMLAVQKYQRVRFVFADTGIEDEDLYRFLDDIEATVGVEVERIAEGRTPWEVFRDRRYIGNTRADPCSLVLKRELLRGWLDTNAVPGDHVVVGIDWTETHRCQRIAMGLRPYVARFPLIRHQIDKVQALAMLDDYGIAPPRLYEMGFPHNNCGGFCVKAGQAQFALLLDKMPDRYRHHEEQEQDLREHLDKDVAILRDRRGGTTKPMTLRDFRIRITGGDSWDRDDWGACGCALPGSQPSQLALDLFGKVPGV